MSLLSIRHASRSCPSTRCASATNNAAIMTASFPCAPAAALEKQLLGQPDLGNASIWEISVRCQCVSTLCSSPCSGDPTSGYPANPAWQQMSMDEAMGILLEEGAFGTSPELSSNIGAHTHKLQMPLWGGVTRRSWRHLQQSRDERRRWGCCQRRAPGAVRKQHVQPDEAPRWPFLLNLA